MNQIETVKSALHYVKRLHGTRVLVKLGGAAVQAPQALDSLLEDLALMRAVGVSIVLVHGGGPAINAELAARGIAWEFIEGQRVTTPPMMEVIESVLGGTVNRGIVRALNLAGIPAVGLSGIDASTLMCKPAGSQLGQVGVIEEVDTSLIHSILAAKTRDGHGAVPVIAPIGIGANAETFNLNADWAASRIAQALGIRKLIFLTDQEGVLDTDGKVLPALDASELEGLIEAGVVKAGMLTKARTILDALRNGVGAVHVLNGKRPHALVEELFTESGAGTICRLRSRTEGAWS